MCWIVNLALINRMQQIVSRRPTNTSEYATPRIITLGGDHTTTLSALRSTYHHWGEVSVIHFDSHIGRANRTKCLEHVVDLNRYLGSQSFGWRYFALCVRARTFFPLVEEVAEKLYRGVNHGTFLHIAHEEGLIRNTSIHAGIRAPVSRPKGDVRNDIRCGFQMIKARDIDLIGVMGVIEKIKQRISGLKVYISVDIDVLDPAFAPGKLCFLKSFVLTVASHRNG